MLRWLLDKQPFGFSLVASALWQLVSDIGCLCGATEELSWTASTFISPCCELAALSSKYLEHVRAQPPTADHRIFLVSSVTYGRLALVQFAQRRCHALGLAIPLASPDMQLICNGDLADAALTCLAAACQWKHQQQQQQLAAEPVNSRLQTRGKACSAGTSKASGNILPAPDAREFEALTGGLSAVVAHFSRVSGSQGPRGLNFSHMDSIPALVAFLLYHTGFLPEGQTTPAASSLAMKLVVDTALVRGDLFGEPKVLAALLTRQAERASSSDRSLFLKARAKQLLEQLWQLSTSSIPQQEEQQDKKQPREQGRELQEHDASQGNHMKEQLELTRLIPGLLAVLTRNQGGGGGTCVQINEEGMCIAWRFACNDMGLALETCMISVTVKPSHCIVL